jgi:hypothetical protein
MRAVASTRSDELHVEAAKFASMPSTMRLLDAKNAFTRR